MERRTDGTLDLRRTKASLALEALGRDAPIETNALGAKQSRTETAFDCLDGKAMLALGNVLFLGKEKYGKDNWRNIPTDDHLNHAMMHIFAHLAGDKQDVHLEHAFCRLMFAVAMELQD